MSQSTCPVTNIRTLHNSRLDITEEIQWIWKHNSRTIVKYKKKQIKKRKVINGLWDNFKYLNVCVTVFHKGKWGIRKLFEEEWPNFFKLDENYKPHIKEAQ